MSQNNFRISEEDIENNYTVNKKPFVSVVVVTYQHEKYIRECLDGILQQKTNFPFEIIIGEDQSSDGTREICKEYADKYPETIKLFLRSRKTVIYIDGKATGRYNFLENLKSSQGKYTAICEGDDYWSDPNKLQKQVDFLEANEEYAGCYHNSEVHYQNKEKEPHLFRNNLAKKMTTEDTFSATSPFHTSSFMFRKAALTIPDLMFKVKSGDMALFSIISAYGPLGKVEGILSAYRKNDGGITRSAYITDTYNEDRIDLMTQLNVFHNFKYDKKAKEIITFHQNEIFSIEKKDKMVEITFFQKVRAKLRLRTRIKKIFK